MIGAVTPDGPSASASSNKTFDVEDSLAERRSAREALRAKLREQEKRLSNMVRTTQQNHHQQQQQQQQQHPATPSQEMVAAKEVADATAAVSAKVIEELKNVKAKLEDVEQEKSRLESEVNLLKQLMSESEALKSNYADMDERFEKQLKRSHDLKAKLTGKEDEIEMLRSELAKKLQRIVELEFELETHELNYTNYADELFKLGEDALEEIKGKHGDHHLHEDAQTPKKAKRLISKLLADLDDLEMRYKDEKIKSASMLEEMRMENTELQTQVQILEQKMGLLSPNSGKHAHDAKMEVEEGNADHGDDDQDEIVPQQKRRIEKLEAKNALYRKEMEKLKAELAETRRDAQADAQRAEHNSTRLQNEVYALKAHVEHLEAKHKWGGVNKKKQKGHAAEQYAAIEKRIEDNYNQVIRLQNSVEIKDRQIATLKIEVANLRKKEIAEGHIKDTHFTESDAQILRDESMQAKRSFESDRTGSTRATDTSCSSNDL